MQANVIFFIKEHDKQPYPFEVQTERIVLKIQAAKEIFFNITLDDF